MDREDRAPAEVIVFPLPGTHFLVHEVRGREAISELFSFDVVASCDAALEAALCRALIGQRAALRFLNGPQARLVRGVVSEVELIRQHGWGERVHYRLRVVPRMWLTTLKRQSRIFQHQDVEQVVTRVLGEAGIQTKFLLDRPHPERLYCTQYEETDYEFVSRLLAEAGVFFHFGSPVDAGGSLPGLGLSGGAESQHAAAALHELSAPMLDALFGTETVVCSDAAHGYMLSAVPTLHFLRTEGTNVATHDKVTQLEVTRRQVENVATYTEYDPRRPEADLVGTETRATAAAGTSGVLSAALRAQAALPALEYYDHHGPFLSPSWEWGATEPARILRQRGRERHVLVGESGAPTTQAGHKFRLEDHALGDLNRDYAVIGVQHHLGGQKGGVEIYRNEFTCVPAEVVFCPARPPRQPVTVVETATVVGAGSEEIYTDDFGRIKVQFHWDRGGQHDEHSSCWIRTMHSWAGSGWGTQFIPRVGMEVVVAFEGGDPDKPLCLGTVSNGTHPPAFALPEQRTKSGIRTQTTPGANGFNELSFDDNASRERVYLHAQRDFDTEVRRDYNLRVAETRSIAVDGADESMVKGDASLRVGGDYRAECAGSVAEHVEGNQNVAVLGDASQTVKGAASSHTEGRHTLTVDGIATQNYATDRTLEVRGNETHLVGRHDNEKSYQLHVEGRAAILGTRGIELASDDGIVLRSGKSMLRIGPDGIEMTGPALQLGHDAATIAVDDRGLTLRCPNTRAELRDGRLVFCTGDGALFSMGKDVKIDAQKILLNSPDRPSEDPPPEQPPKPTEIILRDQHGGPLPHQRYVIRMADGREISGLTNDEGRVELELPADAEIRFPDLRSARPV